MILNDLIDRKVEVMILNQGQENLSPRLRFEGVLKGVDQGTYILERTLEGGKEFVVLPIALCRINTRE
ncbi:hypothetical protein OXIME_001466 [Oxyplasma meridianum]|uniref:Uncharacterized protein n=1 Tax=Oxyplasma meridianum TaxID=3073602 RepID=A0AAX4NHI1_9ARCH